MSCLDSILLTNRHTDTQTDRQTDKETDRQTDATMLVEVKQCITHKP